MENFSTKITCGGMQTSNEQLSFHDGVIIFSEKSNDRQENIFK